jgi:D-sedoheptulose 7-phosphate isomerase
MTSPSVAYLRNLATCLDRLDHDALDHGIALVRAAWQDGRQIITLGNGGSAMTALHLVTDWAKMVHLSTGRPFRGRSLVDNIGLLTAYANDLSYADIFAEQMKNVAVAGDLVVAISGSGNSENVIRAVTVANEMGCETLGLCGFRGGRLKAIARHVIWVDVDDMQLCEDVHAIFGHMVMKALCHPEQLADPDRAEGAGDARMAGSVQA